MARLKAQGEGGQAAGQTSGRPRRRIPRRKKPAPLLAFVQGPAADMRTFCLECLGGDLAGAEACRDASCPLHEVRLAALHFQSGLPEPRGVQRGMLRACRRQCLMCAGSPSGVRTCDAQGKCSLWQWRFGVHPQTYASVTRRFAPRLARGRS